jgi:hypothetical protein
MAASHLFRPDPYLLVPQKQTFVRQNRMPQVDIRRLIRSVLVKSRSSCPRAWSAAYGFVPASQMSQIWCYFNVRQTATNVDRDQRSDIGNCKAIAGNEYLPN